MSGSSVPTITWGQSGPVAPQEHDILVGTQADINQAFGGNLNPALETPQGQIATSITTNIAAANSNWLYIANQIDPDYSGGIFQDAIAKLYLLTRKPAIQTTVQCVCIGLEGVPIPVGAQASDVSGNRYLCTQSGTIPVGGSITLSFACVITGPIACPANSLNLIYQSINGWDSINNPADGIPGAYVENRADFEARRKASVALNAHGSLDSIFSAVFNVATVEDILARENTTGTAIIDPVSSYSMLPHSLYIAVVGGIADDVAAAIWTKKDVGCDYNGNTSITVYDNNYSPPAPYIVQFERPTSIPVFFAVNIVNDLGLPSNIEDSIKAAIIAAFAGADGGKRERIGSTVYASRFYAPVALTNAVVSIIEILVGLSSPALLNSVAFGIDQFPTVISDNILVSRI